MRISFYLDKPQAKSSVIMLNVALFGQRLRFGTGIVTESRHWNSDRQEPRTSDPFRNANRKRLAAISHAVSDAFNAMNFANSAKLVAADDILVFKSRIHEFIDPERTIVKGDTGGKGAKSLIGDFAEFIATHTLRTRTGMVTMIRPSSRTLALYQNVLDVFNLWASEHKASVTYDAIDLDFYTSYCTWLAETRGITDSTASNHIKVLKTFLKWAMLKGYHNSRTYEQFFRDRRFGDTISLSTDELRTIRDLDLRDQPRLERTRDHFLLQCFTGMRYGDLIGLLPHHFDEAVGIIRFTTKKTGTRCVIPITAPLNKLLTNYPSKVFEFASDVKQNLYLKEVARLAGFNQQFTVTRYKGGRRVDEVKPRHDLVTTHVARRSFATISLRLGVPEAVIASVTGHSAKGMLQQHYIRLSEEDIRDMVVKAWDQF